MIVMVAVLGVPDVVTLPVGETVKKFGEGPTAVTVNVAFPDVLVTVTGCWGTADVKMTDVVLAVICAYAGATTASAPTRKRATFLQRECAASIVFLGQHDNTTRVVGLGRGFPDFSAN